MRISYSALETYRLCPQKFKFEYLDRIPGAKSAAAVFGTELHAALKHMFTRGPLYPTLDEVLDYFRNRWERQDKLQLESAERATYRAEGERIIRNFYAKNPPWVFTVADLESPFEVILEDLRRREVHVLAGRIDRIDKREDGYEIIDYKTNRRMPSQADVDRNLQLSIYALGLTKRWPHVPMGAVALSLYFLRHGEKLSTTRTPESVAATSREALAAVAEIQSKADSGDRFEPTPGGYCETCPYRPICPAWRHLYRKQETGSGKQEEPIDAVLAEYFDVAKRRSTDDLRLVELKARIKAYMETEGVTRVFSGEGFIAQSLQRRFTYDFGKVREILEPLGKWDAILAADEKKLKAILKTLPPEAQADIEAAKSLAREFTVLTASKRAIPPPPQVG